MEDVPRNDAGAMIRQIKNGNPSHHIGFGSLVFSTKKHLNHNKIPPTSFRTSFAPRGWAQISKIKKGRTKEELGGSGGKNHRKIGGYSQSIYCCCCCCLRVGCCSKIYIYIYIYMTFREGPQMTSVFGYDILFSSVNVGFREDVWM